MSTGDPAAALDAVTVRYGRVTALERVSFAVPRGSTFALLGRNGAGKSSAMRCLLGQRRPEAGRATLFGRDVWRERTSLMERIGVVPEEPDFPPEMNASALVAFCGSLYRTWDTRQVMTRLDRFGVPLRVPNAQMSKGQKAQLALALALGHGPELLLLDDPTLGLDVIARRDFFTEVIGELADRGMTIVMTTHDLAAVERIADHIVILNGGKVVLDDDIETVKAAFRRLPDGTASLEEVFAAVVEQGATGVPREPEAAS